MNNQKIKDHALFAYVVLTVLGAYTAFVFYAGSQSANAAVPTVTVITHTSK